MSESISSVIPDVKIIENRAITTSIAVADYFQKRHDHVLDKIRAVMLDCDPAWRLPNFRETFYNRQNPNGGEGIATPMYELTRDAFVLIVMGFTGKKALQWKIDYINAFNKMEAELQHQHSALFPLDADLFVQIRNGKTIRIQQARPGEHFATFDSFKRTAELAGYLVIHCDDLRQMTMDAILAIGEQRASALALTMK